jgi:hypothetical protein
VNAVSRKMSALSQKLPRQAGEHNDGFRKSAAR